MDIMTLKAKVQIIIEHRLELEQLEDFNSMVASKVIAKGWEMLDEGELSPKDLNEIAKAIAVCSKVISDRRLKAGIGANGLISVPILGFDSLYED